MTKTVAELEAELAAAKKAESEERNARYRATKPIYRFTMRRAKSRMDHIHDDSVIMYRLEGEPLNVDELVAAGHDLDKHRGGMNYLFNTASGKLICATGGGRVWLHDGTWGSTEKNAAQWDAIGDWLAINPDGGDITHLMRT